MNKRAFFGIFVGLALASAGIIYSGATVNAEDPNDGEASADNSATTSVGLTPVSRTFKLESDKTYDSTFTVNNESGRKLDFEIFSAPYSYIYSEDNDSYQLGFNKENNFTQISRWISFQGDDGGYSDKLRISIDPNSSKDVNFRIITPKSIPTGGQYAVVFARTTNGVSSTNGVKTEASPGMIVYGRSEEGDLITTSEINNLQIHQSVTEGETTRNLIGATAKVKNTGNVDFAATGSLKVEGIFGGVVYETPDTAGRISVIPESELVVADNWEDTPGFGIFKATWTVTTPGDKKEIEQVVVINILPVIIIAIIVLTILIIGCIIGVKKRRARRSRIAI